MLRGSGLRSSYVFLSFTPLPVSSHYIFIKYRQSFDRQNMIVNAFIKMTLTRNFPRSLCERVGVGFTALSACMPLIA